MQINPVSTLTSVSSGLGTSSTSAANGAKNFSDIFNDALQEINDSQTANQQSTQALLSGQDEGLETTMITAEKAKLTLELGLAVRNKVMDAYNEIIKMQI